MEIIALVSLVYYIFLGSALYFSGELFKRSDEVISYFRNVSFNVENQENQENDIKRILGIIGFTIQAMAIILVISQFIQCSIVIN